MKNRMCNQWENWRAYGPDLYYVVSLVNKVFMGWLIDAFCNKLPGYCEEHLVNVLH